MAARVERPSLARDPPGDARSMAGNRSTRPATVPRAERRRTVRARRSHADRPSPLKGPLPFVVSAVVIAIAIGWSVVASRGQPASTPDACATAAVATAVTSVPADVLDRVGSGGVADPLKSTDLALLRGPSGRPLVLYVGADYCPYCASERWSLIVALSRFGTFKDLSLARSSSTDVYPDTPTFTFRGASYSSDVIEFSFVETADRTGAPLGTPTPVQQASMSRSDPRGGIPFVSIADRFVAVGSGYSPDVLAGRSWSEIAAQLTDPASPVARAILGNANRITAAICRTTSDQPVPVCASTSVRGLAGVPR